eukprot:CAMPEP_0177782948 /NCGR_PEP_ID=MMETSP0491_2-20121128/18802_1 /TAXON_ID=63592 /ORGANISM="Tetraselmis chuii, Strain PLY429" /LENGTH=46 /DNA_ID= /DNA_START= /DNA_END= /DNA_ORIENTATION=
MALACLSTFRKSLYGENGLIVSCPLSMYGFSSGVSSQGRVVTTFSP